MERNKKAFTGDGNLIIYKILFHQDIFSYPHNDYIFIHWMFMIVPAKIQRAFEECLKWLRKPYLSSSVTWCRYQIVATNSHSSSSKDGWTKPYFVIMPVKSLSIALTILHWSWYRWESASSHHPTHTWGQCWHTKPGLVLLEGHKFVTVSAVAVSFPVPFAGSSNSEFGAGLVPLCCYHNSGSSPPTCPSSNKPCPISPFSCHWPEKVFKLSHSSTAPGTYS